MEDRANKLLVANVNIPGADAEVSWALPKNCIWFTLQVRDGTVIRIAVESGHVASSEPPYYTLQADNSWDEQRLKVDTRHGLPLYFACGTAGKVVEVIMGVYDENLEGE